MLFRSAFMLFVTGGLWLALWRGNVRLMGLVPALLGLILLVQVEPPDLIISGDGRHVGITGEAPDELLVLRESRSDYTRDNLTETAGMNGEVRLLDDWPGARCNAGFCAITLRRGGRMVGFHQPCSPSPAATLSIRWLAKSMVKPPLRSRLPRSALSQRGWHEYGR